MFVQVFSSGKIMYEMQSDTLSVHAAGAGSWKQILLMFVVSCGTFTIDPFAPQMLAGMH